MQVYVPSLDDYPWMWNVSRTGPLPVVGLVTTLGGDPPSVTMTDPTQTPGSSVIWIHYTFFKTEPGEFGDPILYTRVFF